MKESISYTFLLNIIIVFIFVCFSVIMGIFSYYRAFRANTIISQTIEKYEGYNCASKQEIATKLSNIAYNTPFKVTCDGKENPCLANEDQGYKIISYNLDNLEGNRYYANNNEMSSPIGVKEGKVTATKNYQYGIYTYMYVELPVVSNILRIPFFAKTDIMYEFRDLNYYDYSEIVYDERRIPKEYNKILDTQNIFNYSNELSNSYAEEANGGTSSILNIDSKGYEARERAKKDIDDDWTIDSADAGYVNVESIKALTGIVDNCKEIRNFKHY